MDTDGEFYEDPKLPEPESENTLEVAEEHYRKINRQLDILDEKLQAACDNQEYQWDNRVRAAKPKETGDEHIIGIIGATGAGKSALLNAILDEEFLVPTSCVQACTAAVTEVAYNRSSVHDYRATVEFVSQESWYTEIYTLLQDTASSATEDFSDDTSEAAIALAKLSAVYPDLDSHSLSKFTADDLISRPGLGVLGTNIELNATSGFELFTKLQRYVESKEKMDVSLDSEEESHMNASHDIEYWPLIQKVRIFTKAAVLKTGSILVDLPGIADVNAARASIAQEYLAKCASLWIVVPIVRAVDDKVGRNLLGERFKRQLRRDGALGRVAFICSKADLGFIHELKGRFMSDSTFKAQMQKIEISRQKYAKYKTSVTSDIKEAMKSLQNVLDQIASVQLEHDAYAKLLEMKKQGMAVHPPMLRRAKRNATAQKPAPRKRTRLSTRLSSLDAQSHFESDMDDLFGEQSNGMSDVEQDTRQPAMRLTELQAKLDTTQKSLHELQSKQGDHELDLAKLNGKGEKVQRMTSWVAENEWDACYRARNRYVAKVLQSDFKLGIRDLERAEIEEDPDFDPTAEVAKGVEHQVDLPVFCTASQSFQQLRGRLEDDPISGKFTDIEQTGIPDLMQYCIDIGGKEIVATRATYTNLVSQLITSVRFWLSRDDEISVVQPVGTKTIHEVTERLVEDIENISNKTIVKIESEVKHVVECVSKAATAGEKEAMVTVKAWGASPCSDKPGLHHATYRAVLRRGGVFLKPGKEIDWIGELLGPMMRYVDGRWNRAFNEAIPAALKAAKALCPNLIDEYLAALGQNYEFFVAPGNVREMFRSQFERLKTTLEHVFDTAGEAISQDQAQANRRFTKTVSSKLSPLFTELGAESGRGVFTRVKRKLEMEMETLKRQIFTGAARKVRRALDSLLDKSRQSIFKSVQDASATPRQDCKNLFAKMPQNHSSVSAEHQVDILETVREIEGLLGIKVDEVMSEVNSQPKNGEANTTTVKANLSSQPVEILPSEILSAIVASDHSMLTGEAENGQVLANVVVTEGPINKDNHQASTEMDGENITTLENEIISILQAPLNPVETTADIDQHVALAEYHSVAAWSFELAEATE